MKHNASRSILMTAMILMVFLFSAMTTIPVLADGEIPPPPPTDAPTEVAPPSAEAVIAPTDAVATPAPVEAVATNAPVVDTVAPTTDVIATDTPIVDATTPTDIVPTDAPVAATVTTTAVLSQVPDNTQVVVTDTNGNTLPLATQDAAQALATGDPIWCPNGVAPKANTGGCSASFATLLNLVTGFVPTGNGTIWITSTSIGGADASGSAITINGSTNWASAANFSLTLKGGWNGIDLSTVTNSSDPSTFSKAISIINWNADVTLNDIVVSGVASGNALTISTTKKVALNRVKVQNNSGSGAKIDNTASGTGTGDVLITFSKFLNNTGGTGLEVDSRGTITLSNVFADGNGDNGADLDNSTAPSAKNVIINTGNNEFNNNAAGYGLIILSKGTVLFKDITANSNGVYGVSVDNSTGTAQAVTITGTNIFSGNFYDGLVVWSSGAISVSNLVANNNGLWGTYLDNRFATTALPVTVSGINELKFNGAGLWVDSQGAITISNLTVLADPDLKPGVGYGVHLQNSHNFASNVTMTGTNVITGNYLTGLWVLSNGAITLNNITTNNNGTAANPTSGWGAYIDNSFSSTPMAVTLTGKNTFSNNYSGGLYINSKGAITLNNMKADGNTNGYGAYLDNHLGVGGVTIKNTPNYSPSFSNNGNAGLYVLSTGNITIMDILASQNGSIVSGDGVYLNNTFGSGNITLGTSRVNWLNYLSANRSSGIEAYSNGAFTLMNLYASSNGGYGALIHNETASTPKAVTMGGTANLFQSNDSSGLYIITKGAITLNNINIYGSTSGYGAYLDNHLGVGDIIVKNTPAYGPNFSANGNTGLYALSAGNIVIMDIHANDNRGSGDGVYLDNTFGTGNISLGTSRVNWTNELRLNAHSGLEIYSNGAVTLMNLYAEPSQGYGVLIHNETASSPKAVTIGGASNNFTDNLLGGLYIFTKGAITLNNIRAEGNQQIGALLDNLTYGSSLSPQNVTINGTNSFSGNLADGLAVYTYGTISLNNVTASGNRGYGAYLSNRDSATPKVVTLNGNNSFNGNVSGGLSILTKGAITVNNITANGNTAGYGAYLDNRTYGSSLSPQNVTINGTNSFSNNFNDGLVVSTYGAILLNKVTASNNGGYGAYLSNKDSAAPKTVALTGYGTFDVNPSGGLYIITKGAITLSNISAGSNMFGASLDNQTYGSPLSPQNVTVNGTNTFSANTQNGLVVNTYGAILVNNVYATRNSEYGVYLSNIGSVTPKAVTVNGTNFFTDNTLGGLQIQSAGAIKVNNLAAYRNTGFGANLMNNSPGIGITITGYASFDDNGTLTGMDGLTVTSLGPILISDLTTYHSGGNGADLNNIGGSGGVTLNGSYTQAVGNGQDGIRITTNGAVLLSNLGIERNGQYGVLIDNTGSGVATPQYVTLTGDNDFYSNVQDGLHITTFGAITIHNIFAYCNGAGNNCTTPGTAYGAWLDNCGYNGITCTSTGAPRGITLTGYANFESNGKDGLWATSIGAISINNLDAEGNIGNGAYLNNQWDSAIGGITLTGSSTFWCNGCTPFLDNNTVKGLLAYSHGAITLGNVSATSNRGDGIYLDNTGPISRAITITGFNTFSNNGNSNLGIGSGLVIYSVGQITLSNVTAESNQANGVYLYNYTSLLPNPGIKLTGINTFNKNGATGLYLYSNGVINLNNITADFNGGDGLYAIAWKNLTLACGSLNNNGDYGWFIDAAPGTTILKGVNGSGNTSGNFNTTPESITRTCPVPAPVVVAPHEKQKVERPKITPPPPRQ